MSKIALRKMRYYVICKKLTVQANICPEDVGLQVLNSNPLPIDAIGSSQIFKSLILCHLRKIVKTDIL